MDELNLRPATFADADLMLAWRNAESVRRFSLDTKSVAREAHLIWLEKSLVTANRYLFIAETKQGPVGVLRYDLTKETAEISIYMDPAIIGQGYGALVLQQGEFWLKQHHPGVRTLIAKVLPENTRSCSVFEKVNFKLNHLVYQKTVE